MDIHSFFGASTSSSVASSSTHTEKGSNCSDSDSDVVEPPSMKACWLVYDDINSVFCRICKQTTAESATQHTGGVWVTKPFQSWKKATERMKAHESSSLHTQTSQALLVSLHTQASQALLVSLHTQASQALLVISNQSSVVQQVQRVDMQEREKNRAVMKSLVRCTHFLTWHHISHSTYFTQLVDLVVSCGARELEVLIENASKNAVYTF